MTRVSPPACDVHGVIDRRRFGRYLLGSAGALTTGGRSLRALAQAAEPRRVFAHYMVCCPIAGHDGTVDEFRAEIRQAQGQGIDGFALNCGSWTKEPYYRAIVERLFEAAASLGTNFKLFFSADGLSEADTVAMVSEFYDQPNMYRFEGKPMLSTFAGDPDWADAVLRGLEARQHPVTFVPFFYAAHGRYADAEIANLVEKSPELDGYFYFGAAGFGEEIAGTSRRLADAWRRAGKPYMAPVTPYYRGLGPRNYRLFETRGFEGMAMEWEAAIAGQAQWVEIVTWNDWGESTYVASFGSPSETTLWDGHWGPLLSHEAYLAASANYIRWFKTGEQRIERDDLFWFYRLAPKSVRGLSQPLIGTLAYPDNADSLLDRVFATTFLTAPALLRIDSGDHSYEYPLPDGIHHVSVDFWLGPQRFTLLREGQTVLVGEGAFPIGTDNRTNFNYLSGQASPV